MIQWFKKSGILISLRQMLMLLLVATSPYLSASEPHVNSNPQLRVTHAQHQILAIVSDRSSASLVAGAHHYLNAQNLKHNKENIPLRLSKINIRSVSQINQLDKKGLQTLLGTHQTILFAGVFGEPIERLLASSYPRKQTRIIVNSDRRLMPLHQDRLNAKFTVLSKQQQNQLMKALEKNNYIEALKKQQQAWPQFNIWLQARAYW